MLNTFSGLEAAGKSTQNRLLLGNVGVQRLSQFAAILIP